MATKQPTTPAQDTAQDTQNTPQTALAAGGGGTALALPSDVLAGLAAEAKEAAAKERPALSKISLKSGILSYGGTPMANNAFECVIVGASYRNAYYAGRYDPNNIVNPNCFALAESDEGMTPHENVTEPENGTCSGCPKAEWGSSPTGGRGKACKETRRLVLLPASALDDGPEKIKTAELAILDIPVTSVRNYSQFVNTLAASAGVPGWAAVVKITAVPDAKTQFKVLFQAMRVAPSMDILDALKKRREEALRISLLPYDETSTADSGGDDTGKSGATAAKTKQKF